MSPRPLNEDLLSNSGRDVLRRLEGHRTMTDEDEDLKQYRTYRPVIYAAIACGLLIGPPAYLIWSAARKVNVWNEAAAPFKAMGGRVRACGDGMSAWVGRDGASYVDMTNIDLNDEDLARLRPALE